MQPIKLGIIGCGIAANDLHWPALRQMQDKFKITMVCNHTEQKAKAFAKVVGNVPYVLDYNDLLGSDDVEAVDIILPIHLNFQAVQDTLKSGKHFIVEKPLAANLDEADELIELQKKFSQVKMLGENFYYHPVFIKVKEYLLQNLIGRVYSFFWDIFRCLDFSNKYLQTQWRIKHKYPGGFVLDGGIHNIAAIKMLFGDIVAGCSFVKKINPQIGEMDTFSFQLKTENDVGGVLNIFNSAKAYSQNRLLVLGENGSIVVDEGSEILVYKENKLIIQEVIQDDSFKREFDDFYDAIRNNKKPFSTLERGHSDLRTMLNAFESALPKLK